MGPDQGKRKRSREKALLDPSTEVEVEVEVMAMDDKIWKEFPKDILELDVIAKLPIDALYRFRLVCREWNSLLESHRFVKRCAPQNKPWIYFKTYTSGIATGVMYNPCTKKWRCYPSCTQQIYPSASARGLVCCIDGRRKSFMVGNPVTHTWKEFPTGCLPTWNVTMGMVIYSRGYKIVTVTCHGNFEVYDSLAINGPNIVGTIPAGTELKRSSNWSLQNYVCAPAMTIGNVVYLLISNPDGILSYDVAGGIWEVLPIMDPPNSTDLALAECGGRILLMGLVWDKHAASIAVCVWELSRTRTNTSMMHHASATWTEVDRMPQSWCSDLRNRHYVCFRRMGNTGLLMMLLQTGQVERVFTYDVVNREWYKLPRFIAPGHRVILRSCGGISFFPSLSDVP